MYSAELPSFFLSHSLNSFDEDGSEIGCGDILDDGESPRLCISVYVLLLLSLSRQVGELVIHGGGNVSPGDVGSGNPGGARGIVHGLGPIDLGSSEFSVVCDPWEDFLISGGISHGITSGLLPNL